MVYGKVINEIRSLPEKNIYRYILETLEQKTQSCEILESNSSDLYDKLILDYLRDRKAIRQALSKKIIVIDSIMGSGKSTYMINYINNHPDMRFICIVPTKDQTNKKGEITKLGEIGRYMQAINAVTYEPLTRPTKTQTLKELIRQGKNIVATHALISRVDGETMQLLRSQNYTLIVDECLDCVHPYDDHFNKSDLKALFDAEYVSIDEQGFLQWEEKGKTHNGRYENVKNLCNLHSLMVLKKKDGSWSNQVLIWCMPINFFNLFEKCFICTYLFGGSMQYAYFRLNNIGFTHMTILNGVLAPYDRNNEQKQRQEKFKLMKIISCFDGDSAIFKSKNPFTKTWYENQIKTESGTIQLKRLRDNTSNFFKHKVKNQSTENMYTVYKKFEKNIKATPHRKR